MILNGVILREYTECVTYES